MKRTILALAALLSCVPCRADFKASGDAQVTGQVGVGTNLPRARFHIQISSTDSYAIKASSQNGAPLLVMTTAGRIGLGTASPRARLDVFGGSDASQVGLQLRVGNSSSTTLSSQVIFAYSSTNTYAHGIRTRAASSQNLGNSIDFFLWNSSGSPAQPGSLHALALEAGYAGSTAAVHVMPYGAPDAELVVSNGLMLGGGTLMRAAAGPHSSRDLKTDIVYFGPEYAAQAYQDVRGLAHARFRYKTMPGLMRGLIFEDAPQSIRGPNKTLIFDYRVLNLELALQEVNRKIEVLETKIAALEGRRRSR